MYIDGRWLKSGLYNVYWWKVAEAYTMYIDERWLKPGQCNVYWWKVAKAWPIQCILMKGGWSLANAMYIDGRWLKPGLYTVYWWKVAEGWPTWHTMYICWWNVAESWHINIQAYLGYCVTSVKLLILLPRMHRQERVSRRAVDLADMTSPIHNVYIM
jgi:hypothetical protein